MNKYEQLLKFISEIVNSEGSYSEKRDAVYENASDDDKTNLAEFCSWFE